MQSIRMNREIRLIQRAHATTQVTAEHNLQQRANLNNLPNHTFPQTHPNKQEQNCQQLNGEINGRQSTKTYSYDRSSRRTSSSPIQIQSQ